jgi:UDP-N-acetylglucosamine acyltransferase
MHATLGGHTRVMSHANIGLNATTHQFTVVGQYSIVAAGAVIVKDIPPFCKYIPNKDSKSNAEHAAKKYHLPNINTIEFRSLFNQYFKEWKYYSNRNTITLPESLRCLLD